MADKGHPQTLVASHPGNQNALSHGVYSRSGAALEPRVQELAAAILAEPHVDGIDEIGAVEVAKLTALIEAIDAELAEHGLTRGKSRDPRGLLDLRQRYSRRLAEWLDRYGMTPRGRAEWARTFGEAESLADTIKRKREEATNASK